MLNSKSTGLSIGAIVDEKLGVTIFRVWAYYSNKPSLWLSPDANPDWIPDVRSTSKSELIRNGFTQHFLKFEENGFWSIEFNTDLTGHLYLYEVQNVKGETAICPDPGSFSQPLGVHHASQVIQIDYPFEEKNWKGIKDWSNLVIYQAHPQIFSVNGKLSGIIPRIPYLKDLSDNLALQLTPIFSCPGERDLGYNATNLRSVAHYLGGIRECQSLSHSLHQSGLALVLDLIGNHFGSEGFYGWHFGPYFNNETPWGAAINYDQDGSFGVRESLKQTLVFYFEYLGADVLRLDACHALYDNSNKHILAELQECVEELSTKLNRQLYLIAEDNSYDPKVIVPKDKGGYGIKAQYYDGLHHCVRTILNPNLKSYFEDYKVRDNKHPLSKLAEVLRHGFKQHFSYFHNCELGEDLPNYLPLSALALISSSHDQVSNNQGLRLSEVINDFELYKAIYAFYMLLPGIPFIFFGDEIYSKKPFHYFCDHQDPDIAKKTYEGRWNEFGYLYDSKESFPNPLEIKTFDSCKIDFLDLDEQQKVILEMVKKCLALRNLKSIRIQDRKNLCVITFGKKALKVIYNRGDEYSILALNLGGQPETITLGKDLKIYLNTADLNSTSTEIIGTEFSVSPKSLVLFSTEKV